MPGRSARGCRAIPILTVAALLVSATWSVSVGGTGDETQARISRDVSAGLPVVVHVIVALCDNVNQGIVPVPRHLGNGQDARSNLYWGALYGVRTFFVRQGGWTSLPVVQPRDPGIRERAVFFSKVQRAGRSVPVCIVADAWDGAEIGPAIERFLKVASGDAVEEVSVRQGSESISLSAGGAAHLATFVGHNGLMDFSVDGPDRRMDKAAAASCVVLACASKPYFLGRLRAVGCHPLLLTTGLMAPEAYILDAAIRSWAGGNSVAATREAPAIAYQKYQKCGLRAARNLFWGESP